MTRCSNVTFSAFCWNATTIKELAEAAPESLHGIRDRALILFGFALGHRRSTLVALDMEDLQFVTEGVVVTIRRSKTDQEGQGIKVGIPHGRGHTCPVRAIKEWLEAAELTEGPVFRAIAATGELLEERRTPSGARHGGRLSDQMVARILKRYARAIGRDAGEIAGHSLRSGHITQARRGGADEKGIMEHAGIRSVTTLRRYMRDAEIFVGNSAGKLGL